jgi:hypothetical protein
MLLLGCRFVFLLSAESATRWRIRSVAEHGWFGSGHREIPNPKSQSRNPIPSPNPCSFENLGWDLGFGIWDLGFGICLPAEDDAEVPRAWRRCARLLLVARPLLAAQGGADDASQLRRHHLDETALIAG